MSRDTADLLRLAKSGGILAALWGGGGALHWNADTIATVLAQTIRALGGK